MLDTPERIFVLESWRNRETDFQWMSELLKKRETFDQTILSNALLELLQVGREPNNKLLRYLDLALSCRGLSYTSFIVTIHDRVRSDSINLVAELIDILSNHVKMLRDECTVDNHSRLSNAMLCFVEWMVMVQIDVMKQLSLETETKCLTIFKSCSNIITEMLEDSLLKSLIPLSNNARWLSFVHAVQNINIPLDSCSDDGKKQLASSLLTFTRTLEGANQDAPPQPASRHCFNLPCKLLLYYDALYNAHSDHTARYLQLVSKHYRCSIQKVCVEWGHAHVDLILHNENYSCKELLLNLLYLKFPKTVAELFPNIKHSEPVIISLFEHESIWSQLTPKINCNVAVSMLQILLQSNLMTTEVYERLIAIHSSEISPNTYLTSIKNTERVLKQFMDILKTVGYGSVIEQSTQILSLLDGLCGQANKFTQHCDRMLYVAVSKGDLVELMDGICKMIDLTCDGCHADQNEELNRVAVFDICCLILIRCSMMFGIESIPETATFCKWIGSHVCNPYNPLQTVETLLQPIKPPHHQDNVNGIVETYSLDRPLNMMSLQNLIIALPDALKDIINGISSKAISEEQFSQTTSQIRNKMLTLTFVAIHWLINYGESPENGNDLPCKLIKPFIKPLTSTVVPGWVPRADTFHKDVNSSVFIQDPKRHIIKKSFWSSGFQATVQEDYKKLYNELHTDPTIPMLSKIYTTDNVLTIVQRTAIETLSVSLSDDIKHIIFSNSVFLQTDPRFVPCLLQHTIPELLNDGLQSQWKSYIWALSQLAFAAIDLYVVNIETLGCAVNISRPASVEHQNKRQCRVMDLNPSKRTTLLNQALSVFWNELHDITYEDGYSYSTAFLHRFIQYGMSLNLNTLKTIITGLSDDIIKDIGCHLISHEMVDQGTGFLSAAGYDQNQCSVLIQKILS